MKNRKGYGQQGHLLSPVGSPPSDNESGAAAAAAAAGCGSSAGYGGGGDSPAKEQERFLPIANVSRIMKRSLPANAKISKEAKETVQECVSEFISFVTGEASDKCQREKRKTINGDDLLWAMTTLGFETYVGPLKSYLNRYREAEGEKAAVLGGTGGRHGESGAADDVALAGERGAGASHDGGGDVGLTMGVSTRPPPASIPQNPSSLRSPSGDRETEMERAAPVRSSHTSTAGMLAWPHPDGAGPSPARRPNQPTEEFRKVVFGGQVTDEEAAEGLSKRRPSSAPKSKEMTGSGIFEDGSAAAVLTASHNRQGMSTVSQITFAEDGNVPPKKPTSIAELPSQRDLDRTVQNEGESTMKMQVYDTKSKEISGHDIFADYEDPRPNISRRSDYRSSASNSPVKNANVSTFSFGDANFDSTPKTLKKITSKKSTYLTGNDIFEGDVVPTSVEKPLSSAKLKEKTGSNIFADGKAPVQEHAGRTRQPPGGDSTIFLV